VPSLESFALLIVNIVTATTLLTETFGAVAPRLGLARAGELGQATDTTEKKEAA